MRSLYNALAGVIRSLPPREPEPEDGLVLELRRQITRLESNCAAALRSNMSLSERVGERTAERDAARQRLEETMRGYADWTRRVSARGAARVALARHPPVSSNPCPEVRNDWLDWSTPLEGRKQEMYLDVEGYVTTGIGFLLITAKSALGYNWRRFSDKELATDEEIIAEWTHVHGMEKGHVASYYVSPGGHHLYLDDRDIDMECMRRFDDNMEMLLGFFPELPTLPVAAQRAIASMAWALGAGFPRTWPKFTAAIHRGDWATAATECVIPARGNVAWNRRNQANVALLLGLLPADGGGQGTAVGERRLPAVARSTPRALDDDLDADILLPDGMAPATQWVRDMWPRTLKEVPMAFVQMLVRSRDVLHVTHRA